MRERDARERFARAVEDGGDRSEAEEFGDELAVVASLRRTGMRQEADGQTRHNVAARISSKLAEPEPEPEHDETSGRRRRPVFRPRVLRPALVAASFLLACFGALALLSQQALPGDTLYPVERAREATVLALTFDDSERAEQQLSYAEQRVDELARIAETDVRPGRESADYTAAFTDFDRAVRTAAAALTTLATTSGGSQLGTLDTWAAEQAAALEELAPTLPTTAAERQERSLALLERVNVRADALRQRFDCYQITSGQTDELGVLPATGGCVPPRGAPTQPPGTAPAPVSPPATPDTRREPDSEDGSGVIEASGQQVRESERRSATSGTSTATLTKGTRPHRQPLSFEQVEPLPTPAPPQRPRLPEGAGPEVPPTVPAQLSEAVGGLLDTVP